jgi:hypothetical protein
MYLMMTSTVTWSSYKTLRDQWDLTLHQVRGRILLPLLAKLKSGYLAATKNIEEICNQIVTHAQLERPDDLRIAVRYLKHS